MSNSYSAPRCRTGYYNNLFIFFTNSENSILGCYKFPELLPKLYFLLGQLENSIVNPSKRTHQRYKATVHSKLVSTPPPNHYSYCTLLLLLSIFGKINVHNSNCLGMASFFHGRHIGANLGGGDGGQPPTFIFSSVPEIFFDHFQGWKQPSC